MVAKNIKVLEIRNWKEKAKINTVATIFGTLFMYIKYDRQACSLPSEAGQIL